jgi:4-aminobutyrate aminotransferase-like enzyme
VWKSLSPDPGPLLGLDAARMAPVSPDPAAITTTRAHHIGPSLSISYRRPLTILRGFRQFLYDVDGQPFLDAVNNVPHVGHQHPHVVAAAAAQNAVLNTNTRYLHDNITRYAERLAAKLPDPLSVCYFVCSGSEANELAIRIARTATGRRDIVALDGAYHGNTSTLIDISPYKHDGAGGSGAPEWVHIASIPDPYRGEFAGHDDAANRYADDVRRCMRDAEANGGAAAFIAEPLLGCGGQIVPPAGYLAEAFAHVRAAGGVCIADEVQVGFGRAGSHFWAFETQDVVPDIVTLGKPIGNGFPLAAVVTTPELANAFANGMEYFNTFGGNPVSCAVGNAVLDVLEREDLQANALRVGNQLLEGLAELATRHPIVGDVRGLGLYLGAELVTDPEARAPAARAATYVINRVRDHGILISTDGPDHNVLKLKPPLCFASRDAARFLEVLDTVLGEDPVRATF